MVGSIKSINIKWNDGNRISQKKKKKYLIHIHYTLYIHGYYYKSSQLLLLLLPPLPPSLFHLIPFNFLLPSTSFYHLVVSMFNVVLLCTLSCCRRRCRRITHSIFRHFHFRFYPILTFPFLLFYCIYWGNWRCDSFE